MVDQALFEENNNEVCFEWLGCCKALLAMFPPASCAVSVRETQ